MSEVYETKRSNMKRKLGWLGCCMANERNTGAVEASSIWTWAALSWTHPPRALSTTCLHPSTSAIPRIQNSPHFDSFYEFLFHQEREIKNQTTLWKEMSVLVLYVNGYRVSTTTTIPRNTYASMFSLTRISNFNGELWAPFEISGLKTKHLTKHTTRRLPILSSHLPF